MNEALRELTSKQAASDVALLDYKARIDQAANDLQKAKDAHNRAVFNETQARTKYVELLNYSQTAPNGGTSSERELLARLADELAQFVNATTDRRTDLDFRQQASDKAKSNLAFAQAQHKKIVAERLELAERIYQLDTN